MNEYKVFSTLRLFFFLLFGLGKQMCVCFVNVNIDWVSIWQIDPTHLQNQKHGEN